MEINKTKSIIEAILFSNGKEVLVKNIASVLDMDIMDVTNIIENMKLEYELENRGIQIIKINDSYQLCTKEEYYEYIYPILDNRIKPNLSQAALETLSIISYNPRISRAEIESIRGVNSDGTIYRLLDFNLIEEAGKLDLPGKPNSFKVTNEFYKMFGISSMEELPILPKYRIDENQQIVIDEILEETEPIKVDEVVFNNDNEIEEIKIEE